MGSQFSRYKTPAFVNLDWTPTFTPVLLRKDLDLGLKAAKQLGVALPVTQLARDMVDKAVQAGHTECDFAILLDQQAKAAGMTLKPENVAIDDGLKKKAASVKAASRGTRSCQSYRLGCGSPARLSASVTIPPLRTRRARAGAGTAARIDNVCIRHPLRLFLREVSRRHVLGPVRPLHLGPHVHARFEAPAFRSLF